MYYAVKNLGEISCAHRLRNHKGPCACLHGHAFRIEVVVHSSILDENGMVVDFAKLKELKALLDNTFDHKTILESSDPLVHILKKAGFESHLRVIAVPPTVENLAKIWFNMMKSSLKGAELSEIHVWESATSYAVYIPEKE